MILIRPYIYAAFFGAGMMIGAFISWLIASPWNDECAASIADAPRMSRARYFDAYGSLDRAWGPWTLVVARSSISTVPYVVIGIDTEKRCEDAMKALAATIEATSVCVQSADQTQK